MKKALLIILFLDFVNLKVFATHVRAGELSYTYIGANTFKASIVTYTEIGGLSIAADQDRLPINWGDGITDTLYRTQAILIGECSTGDYKIQENIYEGNHTYSGYGSYMISAADNNLIAGVDNINFGTSDASPMLLADSLNFGDPFQHGPANNSPVLNSLCVALAVAFQPFHYYLNANDADGDSLSFHLVPCPGIPNWVFPTKVTNSGTFTVDSTNGNITWNSPSFLGQVNVGIAITEYRKQNGSGYAIIGTMYRNLQIIITDCIDTTLGFHEVTSTAGSGFYNAENNKIIFITNSPQKINTIILYDVSGRVISITKASTGNYIELDASGISNGLYFLSVEDDRSLYTKKILVSR